MHEYLISLKDDKSKFFFKVILFLWIVSIPFQNVFYQISFVLINFYFIWHLIIFKKFKFLYKILKNIKILIFMLFGILFSMMLSNLLNQELLDPKSWHNILLFPFRFGILFVALLYFYVHDYFSKKEIIYFTLFSSFFVLVGGFVQLVQNYEIITDVEEGIVGFVRNRNPFGHFIGIGFMIILLFVKEYKFKILSLIIFLFFIIFSFSRATWVAIFISIVVYLFLTSYKFYKKDFYIFCIFLLLLAIILTFESVQVRFEYLLNLDSSNRTILWKNAWNAFLDKPLFGHGVDSFAKVLPNMLVIGPMVHNIEIEILLYIGLFGGFFYFSAIFLTFKESYKNKNFKIFCILFYFFILGQFDQGGFVARQYLSFILIFTFLTFADKVKFCK